MAGCSTLQPVADKAAQTPSSLEIHREHLASIANIQQYTIQGRIGVQTDSRGFSGSAAWQHTANGDRIALFSPLGGQVATINASAEKVVLTDGDGKTYQAADAETLTYQTLGWTLPMRGLSDWVLGKPATTAADTATRSTDSQQWDDMGRLTQLSQDGWTIEYTAYANISGYQLPTKIRLHNQKLTLKLVIEQWSGLPGSASDLNNGKAIP